MVVSFLVEERVGGGRGAQNSSRVFAKRWAENYVVKFSLSLKRLFGGQFRKG